MNFYRIFHDFLLTKLKDLSSSKGLENVDFSKITVEPPKDPKHGDFSTNAALVLSKIFQNNPRHIAAEIQKIIEIHPSIEKVEIAGPGFVNATLKMSFWNDQLHTILKEKEHYGDSAMGHGQKINIEYVSVNPTGPMHAGHGRGAVVGDVLANIYKKVGYNVTREYYINDEGGQANILARSTYLRYLEALGHGPIKIPEGLYPGSYLISVGQALSVKYGDKFVGKPESDWLSPIKKFSVEAMMKLIRSDLKKIGIYHDIFTSERKLVDNKKVEKAINVLEKQGLLYEGVLNPPKGMIPEDWEPRPQLLFKSTKFGDDIDRSLKKSDGSWTYFAKDIAYHFDKYTRFGPNLINVWGADHGGYVKRLQSAVKAVTGGKAHVDVILCQMVNLLDKGKPIRMSKRSGIFITLEDIVKKVGKDVVRLIMISRKNDASLDFDFAKVLETSHENPVFYIQYAHARCYSVGRQAQETLKEPSIDLSQANGTLLIDSSEIDLIKKLTQWPRLVEQSAIHEEPHRIMYYLYELSSIFHSLWNKGKENTHFRFIQENDLPNTYARLLLVKATKYVLRSGLSVCGVAAKNEM